MFAPLFLALAVTSFTPSWQPSYPLNAEFVPRFQRMMSSLPAHLRPNSQREADCYWAADLMLVGKMLSLLDRRANQLVREATDFVDKNCNDHDPDGQFIAKLHQAMDFLHGPSSSPRTDTSQLPFPLPPLPDRAQGDLGPQLWTMFQILEVRLAAGGIHLEGEGRACAWASGALSGAEATQRAELGTPGIASAIPVLRGQVSTHCRGQALVQKEAAWTWIREHRATQPLVVPTRAPTPTWPAPDPSDGAFWLAAAMLALAPEAWPILVSP